MNTVEETETATFGGGCFWKPQALYDELPGVTKTTVGYMGGTIPNPTYEQVCADTTGHAEVTQVVFDPKKISYEMLVRKFFAIHDPTQENKQGPDIGTQYRSVVFYHSPAQREIAKRMKQEIESSGKFHEPILTDITVATEFYPAEEYHQKYYEKNGIVCA